MAKICKKIHEFAQRKNPRNNNSKNMLVTPAQTSVAGLSGDFFFEAEGV
jgi:hypothetical protein